MLCLNLPNGGIAPIFNKDIFKILSEHSSSSSTHKALKVTVKESIRKGNAISVELGLMTGMEIRRGGFTAIADRKVGRAEERYVSHWTPLKDEEGRTTWVVLTIAPKM
jgi:phototropin